MTFIACSKVFRLMVRLHMDWLWFMSIDSKSSGADSIISKSNNRHFNVCMLHEYVVSPNPLTAIDKDKLDYK